MIAPLHQDAGQSAAVTCSAIRRTLRYRRAPEQRDLGIAQYALATNGGVPLHAATGIVGQNFLLACPRKDRAADASTWLARTGAVIFASMARTSLWLIDEASRVAHEATPTPGEWAACFQDLFLFLACSTTYREAKAENVLPPPAAATARRCAAGSLPW